MVPWLEPGAPFPDPRDALSDPDGLLAAGADLSPATLVRAYSSGIFPWYDADHQPILWWSPSPRCVFYPDSIHLSKSLRRHIRRTDFTISLDTDFHTVMHLCAGPRREEHGTWISEEMIDAYVRLHELGYAHCLEIRQSGKITGAIYGIQLGRVFFGESMVSPGPNGSKMALAALQALSQSLDIALIDAQVENPHLLTMGARMIDRATFRQHLRDWVPSSPTPSMWPKLHSDWDGLPDYIKTT